MWEEKKKVFFCSWGGFCVDLEADPASRKGWRRIIRLAIKSDKVYKRKSKRFGRLQNWKNQAWAGCTLTFSW